LTDGSTDWSGLVGGTGLHRRRPHLIARVALTYRAFGLVGALKKYGWRSFVAFFVYYLVRDVMLYVALPYLAARSLV
jgi:hypothetical protein